MKDQDALKARDFGLAGSNGIHVPKTTGDALATERPLKRKLDVQETAASETDPKLQEFLEVMQPPSKSKTWANEGAIKDDVGDVSLLPNVVPSGEEGQSDHEYEPVPKKRKKTAESKQAEAVPASTEPDVVPEQESSKLQIVTEESLVLPKQVSTATSDADWLRSRTSRLLGLVDDEDTGVLAHTSNESSWQKTGDIGLSMQREQSQTSDTSVQTDEEPMKEAPAAATLSTLETPEDSSTTGRLFIRNLPYSIAEEELRALFAPYGELEEVGLLFSHDRFEYSLCYDLVMNILIGTAYVMHVMLLGRVF